MLKSVRKEPIAIVSQSCILPGANSPEELWQVVQEGKSCISKADSFKWRINPNEVLSSDPKLSGDKAYCSEGGYISDFDWDPSLFPMGNDYLNQLDPMFKWALQSAYLAQIDVNLSDSIRKKTAVILGNLSYPNSTHSKLFEETLLNKHLPHLFKPSNHHHDNRRSSSKVSQIISENMGFGGDSLCLDAACASSLYAIKIACDKLQSKESDFVLAGGINGADS